MVNFESWWWLLMLTRSFSMMPVSRVVWLESAALFPALELFDVEWLLEDEFWNGCCCCCCMEDDDDVWLFTPFDVGWPLPPMLATAEKNPPTSPLFSKMDEFDEAELGAPQRSIPPPIPADDGGLVVESKVKVPMVGKVVGIWILRIEFMLKNESQS